MVSDMIKKIFRLFYNGIRFIGKSCARQLLAVEVTVKVEQNKNATLCVGKGFRARRNVELNARSGCLSIGNNVFFNSGCIVTARESISIGDGTIFGPYVVIYDHDHAVTDGVIEDNCFVSAPISVGNNVWVGAGSVILKGTTIGDNCIIAAGSVVRGDVPAGTVFMQKRETSLRTM